jgi:hypothetical protein
VESQVHPDEVGSWMATAAVPVFNVKSNPITFEVVPSQQPGFVRLNSSNPRYFETDDGGFFFTIGINMAWWAKGDDPVEQYRSWLEQFSKNGGNTIRVWMAAWSFAIEWKNSGLGNYDQRQYQAWLLDQLFRLADEYQVKIILVLISHGTLSLTTNSEWRDNPYDKALGGMLDNPEQFVTNLQAIAFFQRRLDYIVNRWGYSPDLLAWEWFNEVDLTKITDKELVPWLKQMTAYLRQRDSFHHLTTNSFSVRSWSDTWHLPELDIVQVHLYTEELDAGERDPADIMGVQFQLLEKHQQPKPILMGEFGYSAKDFGEDVEKTGIQLHNGIWATTFSGYAGSGMNWWWDTYVAPNNLWYHFKGLADFIRGEDLRNYRLVSNLKILDNQGAAANEVGMLLQGEKALVWLRSDEYTVDASVAATRWQTGISYLPPMKLGLNLILDDIPNGLYEVTWYDPQTAQWLSMLNATAINNQLSIPVPAFHQDVAAKITPAR